MEMTCFYCGKKIQHENEYNAKKKLNIHLKYCKVRRAGIEFEVGEKKFNIKPRSLRCLQDLKQLAVDLKPLRPDLQEIAFTATLLVEKRNKRIKDFSY